MRILLATLVAAATALASLPAQAYIPLHWFITANSNFLFNDLDLSAADRTMALDSQASLLADSAAKPGATVAWSNAQSGNSGTVVYVKSFEYDGLPCRGLEHRVVQRGLADAQNYRIAKCKVADGTWKTL